MLSDLRRSDPERHAAITETLRRTRKPRDVAVLTGALEVLPTDPAPAPTGLKVAVFLHIWYVDMAGAMLDRVARLPVPYDLFISTGTQDAQARIARLLEDRGLSAELRVVAQNRGRDMSALFITFADVALSGRYDVALRLHSKRTPQMPDAVSQAFQQHLFENLIASEGYAARILDRFARAPRLGLVMPPAVQVGFGTLGHGWFGNRAPLERQARRLGITVPLDDHTPLAPFGTMFWFRPLALAKLFAHPWRWQDYNPEPHHVDGGLAHAQERLIGYAAVDAGYDILQVMTPAQAARNYLDLEYKYQALAGQLSSASVVEQLAELRRLTASPRPWLHRRLARVYRRLIGRAPALRQWLGPVACVVSRLLARGGMLRE